MPDRARSKRSAIKAAPKTTTALARNTELKPARPAMLLTAGRLRLGMVDLRVALMRRTPIKRKDIFALKCLLAIDPIRAVYSVPALMGRTRSSVSDAPEG